MTRVQPAAPAAQPATSRCGRIRSAAPNTAEPTAPATNPACTGAVSHAAAPALRCHWPARAGTTAEAENHTAMPSTSTRAMRPRCTSECRTLGPRLGRRQLGLAAGMEPLAGNAPGAMGHRRYLLAHGVVQLEQMRPDFVGGPVEGGDAPGHAEQAQRKLVAFRLVAGDSAGAPGGDHARQDLRVA